MKKGYIYTIISVLCWSTLAPVTKMLLSDIPNLEALSISSLVASLFLLIVNLISGNIKKMKSYSLRDYSIMAGLGFLGLFLYSMLYYYGLSVLTSQQACILNYLWPIMLVIFSCIIMKEKLTFMKVLAMISSFFGIVILSLGGGAAEGKLSLVGVICCISAAAFYGLFSVLNKKNNYDQNISMMVMWFVSAVFSGAFGIFTENWVAVSPGKTLGLLWLGIFVNAVAYLFWAIALDKSENTARVANFAYLTPFLSLVLSAVLLKEKIEAEAVIALIFIIGGILLQYFFDHKTYDKKEKK